MNRHSFLLRTTGYIGAILFCFQVSTADAEPGCRTGGTAIANAFVRANAMYAMYFGSLESYVEENREHFRAGGDAVRCAAALSQTLLAAGLQHYDPAEARRRQQLDNQMRAMGINPGPQQPDMATTMYMMSRQLLRLARTLPAAADGDYGPLYTPSDEMEQMQIWATNMLQQMMHDPMVQAAFAQVEPLIREAAQLDYQFVLRAANQLANASQ